MARKLGEFLIDDGALTPRQLQEALRSQRIFGGSLGTHLIELGLVPEDKLVAALAQIHSVPAASRQEVFGAPPEVVALLSADFAKRHRAVPFRVDDEDLYLAMQNPADSLAIHEAAFLTGFNVIPAVTPEKVLREALTLYHRIEPLPLRGKSPAAPNGPIPAPALSPAGGMPPSRSATEETITAPNPLLVSTPGTHVEVEPTAPIDSQVSTSVRDIARALAEALHRDEVLDLLLSEMEAFFPRVATFAIRGNDAVLHKARGIPLAAGRTVALGLGDPSVLSSARENPALAYGPVASTPANQDLYTLLGGRTPRVALTLPIQVKGRVVVVVYGDNLTETGSPPDFHRLKRVAQLAALSLEALILRSKILRDAQS